MAERPRQRKTQRHAADTITEYVVAVTGWDLYWLFSLADPKRERGPYSEYSTLTLWGDVHRPTPFRYPRAEVALSGRVALAEPGHTDRPRSLGFSRCSW